MDNLEKSVPNFEGFDISGNTQLPGNNLFNNDILALDTSTDGSFQDPLLDNNEIAPLTLEEDFTGEISESEIAPINLSRLNGDDSRDFQKINYPKITMIIIMVGSEGGCRRHPPHS